MPFQINNNVYDEDELTYLGSGQFGEVYEIDSVSAAKIYSDEITDDQTNKLLKMCSSSSTLLTNYEVESSIAFPTALAVNTENQSISGFSMRNFGKSPKITSLSYDLNNKWFRENKGFQFTDETAIKAVFELFHILNTLASHRIVIGDISGGNILFNVTNRKPGFIDLDSAHFEDWESDSIGTEGYVDPSLLETDLNSVGGLNFDTKSDVYALTVLAFEFLVGVLPFQFGSVPDSTPEKNAKNRLSSLRIIIEGERCLQPYNMRVVGWQMIQQISERIDIIRKIRGEGGKDGEIIYNHFVNIFLNDARDNLLENLPTDDLRNPTFSVIRGLRGEEVIKELELKFGGSFRKTQKMAPVRQDRTITVVKQQKASVKTKDPSSFGPFLKARDIDYTKMISS